MPRAFIEPAAQLDVAAHEVVERRPLEVLHDEEGLGAVALQLAGVDDVRVSDGGRDPRLVVEHLQEGTIAGEVGQDALEDDGARASAQRPLAAEQHLRHAAGREVAEHLVAAEPTRPGLPRRLFLHVSADILAASRRPINFMTSSASRIARVLGNVGACLSIAARRSHTYLEQARELAESSGSHYAVGLNQAWSAMHALFIGDWLRVAELAESASESFEQSREGSCSWEHNVAAGLAVIALVWRGRLTEASARAQQEFRLADGRGDLYGRALFTQNEAFCALAHASLRDTVRLKTKASGDESGSTQKYPWRSN